MVRLSLFLAAVLMLSAMSLVTARFQSRQLFIESERLSAKEKDLDIDWRRLQLERAELARNLRIDELARKELGMVAVTHDRSLYISRPGAARSASVADSASIPATRKGN